MAVCGAPRAPGCRHRAVQIVDQIGGVFRRFFDVDREGRLDVRRLAELQELLDAEAVGRIGIPVACTAAAGPGRRSSFSSDIPAR